MKRIGSVGATTAIAFIVACSAAKMSARQPMSTASDAGATPVLADKSHEQIEQYEAAIDAKRKELGYAEPAPPIETPGSRPQTMATGGPVPKSTDEGCTHGKGETCTDVCVLSDDICDNAKKICDLAKKLPGDEWASGKCETADNSCTEAHKKCCTCL